MGTCPQLSRALHSALVAWAGFAWHPGVAGTPQALARMDGHGLSTWRPSQLCWVRMPVHLGGTGKGDRPQVVGRKKLREEGPDMFLLAQGRPATPPLAWPCPAQGGPAGAPPSLLPSLLSPLPRHLPYQAIPLGQDPVWQLQLMQCQLEEKQKPLPAAGGWGRGPGVCDSLLGAERRLKA